MPTRPSVTTGKTLVVIAITIALAALIHFGLLLPAIGAPSPILLFILAILASASYAGFWAGLTATVISVLILGASFRIGLTSADWKSDDMLRLAVLAIGGLIASALAEELHRARRRAEKRQQALEEEIANRQRIETRLAASEAEFRELAESLPDIMFAADAEGRTTYVNQRWQEFAGTAVVPGSDWWGRVHPADAERAWQSWNLALVTVGLFETRFRLRNARGAYRWFLIRARPITQPDSAARWYGVIADIDAEMRAEETLRDRDEQLRLALESTGLGIFEVEFWTRHITWSDRCRAIWGFDESEVLDLGKIRAAVHPDDRRRVIREFNASRDPRGSGEFAFDVRVLHRDGGVRWVVVRGRSFFVETADGDRAIRGIGTMLDITERRTADQSLREADRRKDEFLAVLAHELRNPLAPIRSALQLVRGASDRPEVIAYARDVLDRQVAQMVRLIDDLLDVGRIASGKLSLRRQRSSLKSIVDSAIETARPLIDRQRHRLKVELPSSPVLLDCDPARISQVLANLLNNAAKYTPDGGTLTLLVRAEESELTLQVRDSGIGIPADAMPSIFDMFVQSGVAPREGHSGLGVGLPLARALVTMHGGTIDARSDGHGRGTEVTVRLPIVVATENASPTEPARSAPAAAARRRVLVVDDNRDAAESLAALLKMYGQEVAVAYDGAQALKSAEVFRPDVVLMDIGMPLMDGHEAARRLRALPWGKTIYIAALSGFGQENDRARSLEAGCDVHLIKPVSPADLQSVVAARAATTAE